jgi:hypothetical protein
MMSMKADEQGKDGKGERMKEEGRRREGEVMGRRKRQSKHVQVNNKKVFF